MVFRASFFVYALALFLFQSAALAELPSRTRVDLERGTPVYELMDRDDGIAAQMDREAKSRITLVDYDTFQATRDEFNEKVFSKLLPTLKGGERGLKKLVNALAGQQHNVATIVPAIARALQEGEIAKDPGKIALTATRWAPVMMLASGAGTAIPLGSSVETYHYGYKAGDDTPGAETPEENRKRTKSGRSYMMGPDRGAYDASDMDFLRDTTKLFESVEDPRPIFKVVFQILTEGDASGLRRLSPEAQLVVGDWFAVYIAEQRRHRMTGWTRMDWENALTELLMLAPYTIEAQQLRNKEGDIVEGQLVDYFGVGTDGSGLGGKAGIERRKYTRAISQQMAKLAPREHQALAELIGASPRSDLCSGVMKYLNNGDNQAEVRANARELTRAAVNYVNAMKRNASRIAETLASE